MRSNGTCDIEFSCDRRLIVIILNIFFHAIFTVVLKLRKIFSSYFYNLQENVKMSVMLYVGAFMWI